MTPRRCSTYPGPSGARTCTPASTRVSECRARGVSEPNPQKTGSRCASKKQLRAGAAGTALIGSVWAAGLTRACARRNVGSEPRSRKRTTSGTVFMRLSFMFSDSSLEMAPSSAGMSSRPFRDTFRTDRLLSCVGRRKMGMLVESPAAALASQDGIQRLNSTP